MYLQLARVFINHMQIIRLAYALVCFNLHFQVSTFMKSSTGDPTSATARHEKTAATMRECEGTELYTKC